LINVELKKPNEMEQLYVNVYGNMFGRAELNMNAGHMLNERWSTGWLAHASGVFAEMDKNGDGFRDLPMGNAVAFLNRWAYQGKKMESQFGVNAYIDQKYGGQIGAPGGDEGLRYAVNIDSRHIDAFAKTGFFMKKPYNSIGVVYNLKYQSFDALLAEARLGQARVLNIGLHLRIVGRPGRIGALDRILAHIKAHEDEVFIAGRNSLARAFEAQVPYIR